MAGEVADKDTILQNLDKLRIDGEYCDVTVVINDEKFRCHRIVLAATSGYFNSLFKSSFVDSTAPEILVRDMNAELFREIFTYLYTGEIKITLENAYDVLKCSDYLVMTKLKENVIKFIEDNPRVHNALKICCYSSSPMGNPEFAKKMLSNVAINFREIIQKDDFLDTDFELLESILREPSLYVKYCDPCHQQMIKNGNTWTCNTCSTSISCEPNEDESPMFSRFADWIMHRTFERLKYFPKLAKVVKLDAKCVDKWEAIISKFVGEVCPLVHDLVVRKTIYVFATTESKHLMNLSWNHKDDCWITFERFEMLFQDVKGVVMEQRQYFLSRKSNEDGIVNQFWVGEERSQWSELQSPPDFGKKYRLASIKDSIYLYMYNKTLIRNYEALPCADFESRTSSINIYAYAVNWNKWFIMPPLPKPLFHSYFVSANDMLFVIGGNTTYSLDSGTNEKILQCFDPRTLQWTQRTIDIELNLLGEACAHNDQVIICEEIETDPEVLLKTRKLYIYDVIADKWDVVTGRKNENSNVGAMAVYDDRLWIFSNYVGSRIETYNLKSKVWNEVSTIPSSAGVDIDVDSKILEILFVLVLSV